MDRGAADCLLLHDEEENWDGGFHTPGPIRAAHREAWRPQRAGGRGAVVEGDSTFLFSRLHFVLDTRVL